MGGSCWAQNNLIIKLVFLDRAGTFLNPSWIRTICSWVIASHCATNDTKTSMLVSLHALIWALRFLTSIQNLPLGSISGQTLFFLFNFWNRFTPVRCFIREIYVVFALIKPKEQCLKYETKIKTEKNDFLLWNTVSPELFSYCGGKIKPPKSKLSSFHN